MEEFLKIDRPKEEIELMSPLTWAYIGDAVYELYVRNKLINQTNLKPHKLHIEAVKYVKAKSQAEKLNEIYETLTDEEKDIVRRGRNTQNHHLPKNSNVQEYMYATAFEALIGYLYLTKQNTRLQEILDKSNQTGNRINNTESETKIVEGEELEEVDIQVEFE